MTGGSQPLFPLPDGHNRQSSYPQVGQTPGSDPPGSPPRGIPPRIWGLVAAASVVLIAVTAAVTLLLGGSDSDSAPTAGPDSAGPGYDVSGDADSGERTARRTTDRPDPRPQKPVDRFSSAAPPSIVRSPDTFGEVCASGFQVSDQSGWGTHSGRGSDQTSCFFAHSVLHAYWDQHGSPDEMSRVVIAAGTVPCASTGGECSGDRFVMRCAVLGQDTWITCTGGKNARVLIY